MSKEIVKLERKMAQDLHDSIVKIENVYESTINELEAKNKALEERVTELSMLTHAHPYGWQEGEAEDALNIMIQKAKQITEK